MKINYQKNLKGTSLIEMIVVVAILSTLSLVVSRFLVQGISSYESSKKGIDMEQDAARVMRDFEYSTRALTEINTANATEFSFLRYYDLDSISPKENRYFLDNTIFKSGITEPFGTPPLVIYPEGNEQIHYLIENVDSIKFQYFDDNNAEIMTPINIPNVRMVQLTITLKSTGAENGSITQITKVNLRNFKKNL
ncbi:MAG: hypothetical protein WCO23_01635 [bacterium]